MICPYCKSTLALSAAATLDLVAPPPGPPPPPPPTPPVVTSVDDAAFTYVGAWATSADPAKWNGGDHYSGVAGASFRFTFTGTKVALYGATAPHHGIATVSIDGAPPVDADCYSAARVESAAWLHEGVLPPGTHTIEVKVSGRKNPASTGLIVAIDRADITGGDIVVAPPPPPGPPPAGLSPLRVAGNKLVDATGKTVVLHGVHRVGLDYSCINGSGFIDGPADAAAVAAIAAWKGTNVVRLGLNESCWLAISGSLAAFSGKVYQQYVVDLVQRVLDAGLYVILELHWNAAGATLATRQQPMLDRDHAPMFWTQVAAAFKGNDRVILEPHNEPYPDNNADTPAAWTGWLAGGTVPGVPFTAAGMQEIVDAIRATGATNVIALGGVQYSNALSQWLASKPKDPLSNLVAAWHVYNFNNCNTQACWDANVGPVAAAVPVIVTEVGSDPFDPAFMDALLAWIEARGLSWVAWAWAAWGTSLSLVADYTGTPTAPWGTYLRNHLAALP